MIIRLLSLSILFCLFSCNATQQSKAKVVTTEVKNTKPSVIGSWTHSEAKFGITTMLTFNADSSLVQSIDGFELNAMWAPLDSNQLKVYHIQSQRTEYWSFQIESDSLLKLHRGLENKTTHWTEYTRVD